MLLPQLTQVRKRVVEEQEVLYLLECVLLPVVNTGHRENTRKRCLLGGKRESKYLETQFCREAYGITTPNAINSALI